MRYDLAFLLCCCKSFLGGPKEGDENDDYYLILQLDRDATPDEIKRAYKRQSLQMHPDKLAQRGLSVTPESQAAFSHMKHAYEVLSDPHQRESYDAVGARGLRWMNEPFAVDPQELAHNFATSSVWDRSKIFAIFVAAAVALLVQPVLVCLHVDGYFGGRRNDDAMDDDDNGSGGTDGASWMATLVPLWIWNVFLLFYHGRVIAMGPISKPDHVATDEWVDPLPMHKRIFTMARFCLIVVFQVLVALKLDSIFDVNWVFVFVPLYVWEATTLFKKWPLARMRIVTVDDLEAALGKPFSEFTATEKELIGKRYSVVSSTSSPDFEAAQKLKVSARHDVAKSVFRIAFCILLIVQLESNFGWNWYLVFIPVWVVMCIVCAINYRAHAEIQKMAMEKDPTLFGATPAEATNLEPGNMYGAVDGNGGVVPPQQHSTLSEQEREELRALLSASSSRLCSKCCSQFVLLVILILFVGKLQGARFSSLWIISPFLLVASLVLCCIGCAIFGVSEVPTDGINFEAGDFQYAYAEEGKVPVPDFSPASNVGSAANVNQNNDVYVPPPPSAQQAEASASTPLQGVPVLAAQVPTVPTTSDTHIPPGDTGALAPAVDLLDSTQSSPNEVDASRPSEINELD